jgi:hypothetical protein
MLSRTYLTYLCITRKDNRENITKLTAIESIVFLSKILTSIERRHWLTKLKIAAVVWVVKTLHHIIKAFRLSIIVWIDYSVTTTIVKQTKMTTSNTNKLNLRLMQVDIYLSQFDLNIWHKSDRDHVISNALFRLLSFETEKFTENQISDILDNIEIYAETSMKMFSTFKTRFIQIYKIDKKWLSLYAMLEISKIQRTKRTRRVALSEKSIDH